MRPRTLLDTGPLVAILDRSDPHHAWALRTFSTLEPPLHSCEAVLAEATHLLNRNGLSTQGPLAFVERGAVVLDFRVQEEIVAIRALMSQYANVPMDFADACLMQMAERVPGSTVVTIDSDFFVYRTSQGGAVSVIAPSE
ncbi:MAG: PIN domain-containing protein [Bacteroidota bacterium]